VDEKMASKANYRYALGAVARFCGRFMMFKPGPDLFAAMYYRA
jgi:hypothetical protein